MSDRALRRSNQSSNEEEEGNYVAASRLNAADAGEQEVDLYIDEELFAILRERREEALQYVSDYNPFVNHTFGRPSLYEKVKLVVGGCTLLPLRCLALGPLLLGLYGLTSLSIVGLSDEKLKEKPLTSWRKKLLSPTVKYGSRILLFLLGYQWVTTKGEASAEAPIVISNHPSWFEHLWILHVYVPSVVGKEDVKKVPLYGTYAKAIQTIFVKRSSPESRKEAAEEINDRVTSRYEKLQSKRKGREERQRARDEKRRKKQKDKTKSSKNKLDKRASEASMEDDLQQSNGLIQAEEIESPRENGVDTNQQQPKTPQHENGNDSIDDDGEEENGHHSEQQPSGRTDTHKNNKQKKGKKEKNAKKANHDDDKNVWPPLFLFPEGGNSSASGFISFKLGAFNPGVPIQPVVVRLPFKHHDVSPTPGTKKFSLLVRTLCQFHNKMDVAYLPVYYPSEEEQGDPKLYARNVRQAMAEELGASGIESTEHAYEDVILLQHALRRKYPHQKVLLEARKLLDRFEILELNKHTLTRCLDKFIAMDKDRSGEVSFQEFCGVLHLPDVDITSRLFGFFDTNNDGLIDFREYITGMATLSNVIKPRARTDLFALFADGEDSFTLDKARETLKGLFDCLTDEQIDGIFSHVGELCTPNVMTYDEFETWTKHNPEYIHFLLTTDRMSTNRRRESEDVPDLGKGKGKDKQTYEVELTIDNSSSDDEVDQSNRASEENEEEGGELQQLQKSDQTKGKTTKQKEKKKNKQKQKERSKPKEWEPRG